MVRHPSTIQIDEEKLVNRWHPGGLLVRSAEEILRQRIYDLTPEL